MEIKHTPTPWALEERDAENMQGDKFHVCEIFDASHNRLLASLNIDSETQSSDAAFVVRACNAHEDVLTALRCARDELVSLNNNRLSTAAAVVRALVTKQIERCNAAIAKAEAQQ